MEREIFRVTAEIVDANGTYASMQGYPKTFDSKNYQNNVETAKKRAVGDWHGVMQGFSTQDTRKLQVAQVVQLSTGAVIENDYIGGLSDPEPEPNE